MQTNTNTLPPYDRVHKNIVIAVILTFITFGIYGLFWQAHQIRTWNQMLGWEKYGFWKWAILTLITFGLYHIYHEYLMAQDLVDIQRKLGRPVSDYLPVVCVILAAFALPFFVANAIQQYELHRLYEPALSSSAHRFSTTP